MSASYQRLFHEFGRPKGAAILSIEGISLRRSGRGRRSKPWAHAPRCDCTLEQTFTCEHCGRRFGWCLGMADELPGACDFCWAAKAGPHDREDCPCGHPFGTKGPCAGCNCADPGVDDGGGL